jgi:hypothetical protein
MITYPDKPWVDGEQFTYTVSDNEEVVGTYDAAKNAWTLTRSSSITTNNISTTPGRPTFPETFSSITTTDDINELKNQKEVNWALADAIIALQEQIGGG